MKRIIFTANSVFSLTNFRLNLILKCNNLKHDVVCLVPKNDDYQKLLQEKIKFQTIKLLPKGLNPFNELLTIVHILYKCWKIRPNIVFSYTIKNTVYFGLGCYFFRYSFYPTINGLGSLVRSSRFSSKIVRIVLRLALYKADKIYCQNSDIQKFLIKKKFIKENNSAVLPGSGVDLKKFTFEKLPQEHDVVFLFIGRLLKSKGIDLFVKAAKILEDSGANASFKIIGRGDPNDNDCYHKEMLYELKLSSCISYDGFRADVRSDLKACHCVVLPSSYDEGVPHSLLEAASMGRLIITTSKPGCREVVVSGINGFILEEITVDCVAQKMFEIINWSEEERKAAGIFSRNIAEKKFDEDLVIDEYMALID